MCSIFKHDATQRNATQRNAPPEAIFRCLVMRAHEPGSMPKIFMKKPWCRWRQHALGVNHFTVRHQPLQGGCILLLPPTTVRRFPVHGWDFSKIGAVQGRAATVFSTQRCHRRVQRVGLVPPAKWQAGCQCALSRCLRQLWPVQHHPQILTTDILMHSIA